jgi:hypothetical protein
MRFLYLTAECKCRGVILPLLLVQQILCFWTTPGPGLQYIHSGSNQTFVRFCCEFLSKAYSFVRLLNDAVSSSQTLALSWLLSDDLARIQMRFVAVWLDTLFRHSFRLHPPFPLPYTRHLKLESVDSGVFPTSCSQCCVATVEKCESENRQGNAVWSDQVMSILESHALFLTPSPLHRLVGSILKVQIAGKATIQQCPWCKRQGRSPVYSWTLPQCSVLRPGEGIQWDTPPAQCSRISECSPHLTFSFSDRKSVSLSDYLWGSEQWLWAELSSVVTPCGSIDPRRCFGGPFCVHLQGWRMSQVLLATFVLFFFTAWLIFSPWRWQWCIVSADLCACFSTFTAPPMSLNWGFPWLWEYELFVFHFESYIYQQTVTGSDFCFQSTIKLVHTVA